MSRGEGPSGAFACWSVAAAIFIGLLILAVKLKEVQIEDSADYKYAADRQSIRRVQTGGERGRILDRNGTVLAGNRQSVSIVCNPAGFKARTWNGVVSTIAAAVTNLAGRIGRDVGISEKTIRRHVNQSLSMPLYVWKDIDHETLSRFFSCEKEFPSFSVARSSERVYPFGRMASHTIGYVGREYSEVEAGDVKFNFKVSELRGRSGLEIYYDSFLRGVPGERRLLVDSRGFTVREWEVVCPRKGLDLNLCLDVKIQREVERQLEGFSGACVVVDPRDGAVLAMASYPAYDPNAFVPRLNPSLYERYSKDSSKPLLNRATGGAYAPGSTFKPVVALAGLSAGFPAQEDFFCEGVFLLGKMRLRCASRWGHGIVDMRRAIMESCNPYFCNLGIDIGTNAIVKASRAFGLGEKTGIDLGVDARGVVPDAQWKMDAYGEHWYQGDVAQMSIGQGMLLTTPMHMALVAGAIGTGRLVTPRLKRDLAAEFSPLPFTERQLGVVREGMFMAVNGDGTRRGTGWRAGEGVPVKVCGKTGTAEIGRGGTRRKNAWFIAYAPAENPTVALAIVIENGESGGATAAPKANQILKAVFDD